MEFSCVQNKLQKTLLKNNLIVSRNLDLPILSCILLTASSDELLLQTTNIEHSLIINLPIKTKQEGTIAVSSEVLSKLISGNNNDVVNFILQDKTVKITTPHSSSELTLSEVNEFPAIPHIETDEETKHIKIPVEIFVAGLQAVSFAASNSNVKPELSSVFVIYETGRLCFVCTDGFRLAEKIFKIDLGPQDFSFLLPVKSTGVIGKIFDEEGVVDMFITENQIAIQNKNMYFTCRLVSGNFPDYKKLIPVEKKTSSVVLKSDLQEVLKVSNIFSNEFHEVLLNIDPKQKLCEISNSNQIIGKNKTNIPSALDGEALSIKFNYRFVSECIPSITTDSIDLSFTEPNKPIKITTVPETQFTYIVMPLNK